MSQAAWTIGLIADVVVVAVHVAGTVARLGAAAWRRLLGPWVGSKSGPGYLLLLILLQCFLRCFLVCRHWRIHLVA